MSEDKEPQKHQVTDFINDGNLSGELLQDLECEGGACPIR